MRAPTRARILASAFAFVLATGPLLPAWADDRTDWGMQCGMLQPREMQLACCDEKGSACQERCALDPTADTCREDCEAKRVACREAFGGPLDAE